MKTWNIIVYCFAVGAFAGCEHEVAPDPLPVREHPLYFTAGIAKSASAGITTRADASDTITPKLVAARDSLLKKTFTEGDVIRICNTKTNEENPSFNIVEGGSPVYQYVWKKYNGLDNGYVEGSDEEDKWVSDNSYDNNSEYLFVPDSIPSTDVKYGFYASDLITDGIGSFQLYATWWREYKSGNRENEPVIEEDQSKINGLLNSDMMLAYRRHSIEYPYAAMRLVFWHVFSMLDVRITLPDYDKGHVNTGEGDTIPDRMPSGYEKDSVKLSMLGIPLGYTVTHSANYNPGQLLPVIANTDVTAPDIPMYLYYTSEPFPKDDTVDEGKVETSDYRTYGFCGILPPLTWLTEQEGQSQPLLRLKLKDPLSGADRYFTYTPNKHSATLTLACGFISVLEFDLPRNVDKMEVVRATIEPWTEAETDVPVTEMGK